ncbi:MAG: DUF4231 domain-containing protein [Nocardioidaceae bacterium]|nr:DUF4231 domain-containing protein [Nocardioidaceae bacterium]NUS50188.1 DUF4231 domain-containing protein [Nocardioidaceae bacterium]
MASHARRSLERWRTTYLGLLLVGSVLAALAAHPGGLAGPAVGPLASTAAVALALATFVQARFLAAPATRERSRSRAAAEGLKGLVYQYLAGVAPYDAPDRAAVLDAKVGELETQVEDLAHLVVGVDPDDRDLPAVTGVADYRRERAEGQRAWHVQAAREHLQRAKAWRTAEILSAAAATVVAALGGVNKSHDLSVWVTVATTFAAAFAAQAAAGQHDRVADSCARTAHDLGTLLRRFDPTTATSATSAGFVADVEGVLAAQNRTWLSLFQSSRGLEQPGSP